MDYRRADAALHRACDRLLCRLALDAYAMSADLGLFLGIGFVAGAAYFRLLFWNARLFARPGSLFAAIAMQALRFGALAAVLALLARQGAAALLLAALGVLLARSFFLRRVRARTP